MNKLQLYIYKSLRGFKSVRNINPSENVQRHILDVRGALDILDYDPADKYLFYMISYVEEGSFFTILRTIPDGRLDHLATTIFVPRGLRITPEEMDEVVRRTTRMVSNPAVSAEELAELHTTFAKEYPVDREAPMTVASEGREYAWCLYGGDTGRKLIDFYGPMLYQPDYLPYAGVLLIDAELGVTGNGQDLSDMQLSTTVPVLPPASTPEGFSAHIYHHPFDRPYLAPLGGNVTIVWRRQGFEDRSQEVTVVRADQEIEPTSTAESRKAISPASFFVTSQASKAPLPDPMITVNGVEINEARYFTQADLKNAEVAIRCPGYFPFKGTLDLASTTQALIQLQEQRRIYRFELPVKTSELGAPIRFEIHTKRDMTDSPVEGYRLLDDIKEGPTRINHLEYTGSTPGASRRMALMLAAGALIVGFIIGWLCGRPSSPSQATESDTTVTETVEVVPETKPDVKAAPARPAEKPAESRPQTPEATGSGPVTREAIAYLDDNSRWSRDEMEKHPGLRGLFDDLNNYRIERIIDVWQPKLTASKNFKAVATAAANGRYKPKAHFEPGQTYNKPGDNVIVWRTYTFRLDP
ncbi:MAG: hypothetical protein Q4C34_05895 [Bacteroidales bacterium]|nr:hypothetical protein [Bacteroidales bacterium]